MNKKTILYIFVVLMALSLTLGAVSAAVDATAKNAPAVDEDTAGGDDGAIDDVDVETENNILTMTCAEYRAYKNDNNEGQYDDILPYMVQPEEEFKKCFGNIDGNNYDKGSTNETADVAVDFQVLKETDFEIAWKISAINNGPDVAKNTTVTIKQTDNMKLQDYFTTTGKFCPKCGVWDVGDLAPGDVTFLLLNTTKVDNGPYKLYTFIDSKSNDYNPSNNFASKIVDAEPTAVNAASEKTMPTAVNAASEKTMPTAGNPIAMALLALITIVGASFIRRF